MQGGQGETRIATDESYTLDPDGKVLRDLPEIAAWKADQAEREKAAKAAAAKRGG